MIHLRRKLLATPINYPLNIGDHTIERRNDIIIRDMQQQDSYIGDRFRPKPVADGYVMLQMDSAVNFDSQAQFRTIKVENEMMNRMLATEFHPQGHPSNPGPE